MVFNKKIKEYNGYIVVDGDLHDLTFIHPNGVIIGLKYKNNTTKNGNTINKFSKNSGFIINC
jgi:filamentous hemagglutinin family protein